MFRIERIRDPCTRAWSHDKNCTEAKKIAVSRLTRSNERCSVSCDHTKGLQLCADLIPQHRKTLHYLNTLALSTTARAFNTLTIDGVSHTQTLIPYDTIIIHCLPEGTNISTFTAIHLSPIQPQKTRLSACLHLNRMSINTSAGYFLILNVYLLIHHGVIVEKILVRKLWYLPNAVYLLIVYLLLVLYKMSKVTGQIDSSEWIGFRRV